MIYITPMSSKNYYTWSRLRNAETWRWYELNDLPSTALLLQYVSAGISFRTKQWYFSSKITLVLIHYQTAVTHRISSVLRECSYINSATLTPSLWKTVTVGKAFLPTLSEFYANAHLETREHSCSSSRIEQPTGRKDAFHIGLPFSGTGQVLYKPCKSWRTSGMPAFKGINTESDPS